jgi:hypothetical protein
MHHNYQDIISRIQQAPQWFDESAVPRYLPFGPDHVADIYADEAVLAEIACQSCARRFLVAMTSSTKRRLVYNHPPLREQVADQSLHYGDPPNVWCCSSGPSMNSEMLRIVEYWTRERFEWERKAELEVAF